MYEYQDEGIAFLAARKAAMLADDPGLGKTRQALLACRDAGAERVLVVTTKSAVYNWQREAETWWNPPELQVTSWPVLSMTGTARRVQIENFRPDVLLVDEAHYAMHPSAERTKFLYGSLTPRAGATWLLTGTPAPGNASQLWTHLRALAPDLIQNPKTWRPLTFDEFVDQFCEFYHYNGERVITGTKNIPELRHLLRDSGFFLRRRKAEVLKSLPPMILSTVPMSPKDLPKVDAYLLNNLPSRAPDYLSGLEGDALLKAIQANEQHYAAERRLIGLIKSRLALEYLISELEGGVQKALVFAQHTAVLDYLYKMLAEYQPVKIDGSVASSKVRDDLAQRFQTDPYTRLFLGQIDACGEALTLTAASHVYFVETSTVPKRNYQAASRAHRIGQTAGLNVRILSLLTSKDDDVQRAMVKKTRQLSQLFD